MERSWDLKCLLCGRTAEEVRDNEIAFTETNVSDLVLLQEHVVFSHPEHRFLLADHRETTHVEREDGVLVYAIRGIDWLEATPTCPE